MALIEVENLKKIAVMKLNHGVTNAITLDLLESLAENLENLKKDPEVKGLVLSSTNDKFFSIGFNIPKLIKYSRKEFKIFYQKFNQLCLTLYTFSKPTTAAITGHAVAGGCILTLGCDYRFISSGKKFMGLNEIHLGVPVPYPAYCILQQLIGCHNTSNIIDSGEFFLPDKLKEMNLIDEVISPEEVVEKSIEKTRLLAMIDSQVYQTHKKNRIEVIEQQIKKDLSAKEQIFIDCWYSENTQKLLKEAVKKF